MADKRQPPVNLGSMMGPGPGRGGPGGMLAPVAKVENVRGVLARLWGYLRRYRAGLLWVTVLVTASTALTLVNPYLIGLAIDRCLTPHHLEYLAGVVWMMIGAHVLSSLGTWGQTVVMIRLSQQTLRDLRRDLFARLGVLPLRFFDTHAHGEVMSRLTNDTETINGALAQTVTQLLSSVLTVVGAGVAMALLNWRLALVTAATTPLIFIITHVLATASRQRFRDRQRDLGVLGGLIEETITGQQAVVAYRGERRAIAQFDEANDNLRRSATAAAIISGSMGPAMNLSRNLTFAVVAAAGGWLMLRGWATIGVVAAFLNYAQHFTRPLNQLAMLWGTVQSAIAGSERVFNLLDEASDTEDAPEAVPLTEVRGEVEFDQVGFGYVADQPVLRDVSFTANAGETVALVGSTGAGKTTIINLLTRFYDVESGQIRLDGHDLRDLRRDDLRGALGIVLQDTFLLADTVRENIRYGRLDATDAEVEQAAALANAAGFIRRLPHGFDTVLSESGGSLSQGQRQLLAIARAALADPKVLVLDEATSSVDTRTELHIQEAMLRLMEGRTAFVIAHRLSTIRQADCILVLQDGRIVERGTHAELLAAQGAYWRLHQLQFVGVAAGNAEAAGRDE
jgi:ATP-binding cassette, subfamily B, multidrug efflux pump